MGILYVVATPIGNLRDITFRAIEVLRSVSYILAEDTRVTRKLLSHYDIKTPVRSFHAHSSDRKEDTVVSDVLSGEMVALVSDAGTPTISDPGSRLIAHIRAGGGTVSPVPGPSAVSAALSVSGVPANSYLFLGFLPRKKGRGKIFREIADANHTVVFFESPHRILKTLSELTSYIPARQVTICRELTKSFEEVTSGTAAELQEFLEQHTEKQRGEFVLIVSV